MKIRFLFSLFIAFFVLNSTLKAQSDISSAGGDSTGNGGSVSFTVGQVAYTSIESGKSSINQGVQQPYEISLVVDSVKKTSPLTSTIYPNPASKNLKLFIAESNVSDFSFSVYDTGGKLLFSHPVTENETEVIMEEYPSAVYYLHLNNKNEETHVYKILKIE